MSKRISKSDLIENLTIMSKKLNKTPKKVDLCLESGSKYSINAYKRAFGNLYNALISADIRPNQARNMSKKDIIQDLQNVYKKTGHTPTRDEYVKLSNIGYSSPTIKKYFGSWTKLLIIANIPVIKAKNVTKNDVIRALKKWYKENNCDKSCLEYWKIRKAKDAKKFPFSCYTVKNKFNGISWEDIMKQFDKAYETKDPYIYRKNSIGIDGSVYLSSLEKEIADYLFGQIQAGRIEKYEYEKLVCENRKWTCDFYMEVDNKKIWIEADGLGYNRKVAYGSGNNEKIIYYQKNKFNYFIIDYKKDIVKQIERIINGKTC